MTQATKFAARNDRPYPARTEKLPRKLEQVTKEWLTSVMSKRYPGLIVENLRDVEIRNGHTTKWRVALDYNKVGKDAGLPRNVCLKANWATDFIADVDIHELEARFYHFLAPKFKGLVPESYYADWDGDGGGQGVVVMEDMGAEAGGVFGHSSQHLGIEGVAKGLGTLAKIHAAWWGNPKLEEFDWLPRSMNTWVDDEQFRFMKPYAEENMKKPEYQSILPTWMYDDLDRFSRTYDALTMYERATREPLCITHGDAHVGNSYVRPSGARIWIDWQLVRKGRPWRDLTYFMLGSLTIDERRGAERDLHKHYRESLLSAGANEVPSLERIWEHYRRWPIYGSQAWLANMDIWGQKGLPMVERFFTAMEDFGTFDLLIGKRSAA